MKTKNFSYSFKTSKTQKEVFELLLDIEKWWSGLYDETIQGKSKKTTDEFTFLAGGGVHKTKQRLVELVPNKKIAWEVVESKLIFLKDPKEWTGTKICFDLVKEGSKTKVTFTHEGLTPKIECYGSCSSGWIGYLDNLKKKLK